MAKKRHWKQKKIKKNKNWEAFKLGMEGLGFFMEHGSLYQLIKRNSPGQALEWLGRKT